MILLALLMAILPTTANLDYLTALADRPLAWAYGRHVAAGNLILRDDRDDGSSVLFIGLGEGKTGANGEGVWDACEKLWVNGVEHPTDHYHFHPGKDGEAGGGGVTGDQKVDLWFPAGLDPVTFSRTAYVAVKIDDPELAPTNDFDVRGIYRTRKVAQYNAGGVLTGVSWTANGVWHVVDVLMQALGEPSTRLDWATFTAEAAYAASSITVDGDSYPRFETHVAFPDVVDGQRVLEALLATMRGYLYDDGGLIRIVLDKPRAAARTLTRDNIADGSFRHWNREVLDAPNRLVAEYRDLENDFARAEEYHEKDWHIAQVGKRRVQRMNLGNTYQQQAARLLAYYGARAVDDVRMVELIAGEESIDLQPMDRVDVEHDEAPWQGLKAFDVAEIEDLPDGSRRLLLQEYDLAAFTDDGRPAQLLEGGTIVGPTTIPASDVTNLSVTENPYYDETGKLRSRVSGSYDLPDPLRAWAGVEIYGRVLDDMLAPTEDYRLLTKSTTSTFAFLWDREFKGETLELQFRSFNTSGRLNSGGPTTTIVLDGLPSAPAAISNLWCQQADMRLILSWERSQGLTVKGYRIYDMGDLTPATDADVAEKYKVGFAPHPDPVLDGAGDPIEGGLVIWEFLERIFRIASSDGTTVQLDSDSAAVLLEPGALDGRKVTFFLHDGTETTIVAVSNTAKSITFAASAAPTDVGAQVLLRGETGVHHCYVRAVGKDGQLSTAKPIPPAILHCFPFARDGSKDIGPPKAWSNPSFFPSAAWSLANLVSPADGQPGFIYVFGAATANPEDESDFGLALKQSINGVVQWRFEVDHSSTPTGEITTDVFQRPATNAPGDYEYGLYGGPFADPRWVVTNRGLEPLYLPGVFVREVRLQARNSYGWGPLVFVFGRNSGFSTGYTGDVGARVAALVPEGGGVLSNEYDVAAGEALGGVQLISVGVDGAVIKFPTDQPRAGDKIRYRIAQGATPGAVTFQNNGGGSFVRMTDLKVPEEANSVTWVEFYAVSSTELEPCNIQTFYA